MWIRLGVAQIYLSLVTVTAVLPHHQLQHLTNNFVITTNTTCPAEEKRTISVFSRKDKQEEELYDEVDSMTDDLTYL